jgi:hypothetical protein
MQGKIAATMLTVEQFLKSCAHETKIIKHLGTKVPESALDYRPTEGQRSMLELMQYLTVTALAPMIWVRDESWDAAMELGKESAAVNLENFGEAMDRQTAGVAEISASLADRDLENDMTQMPWQEPCTVGEFLVNATLKAYTAYRMQFFLYCKAAGVPDLGTMQCWVGIDPPAPA